MKKQAILHDEETHPRRPVELRNLYEVFSSYKTKVPLLGCPCCVSKKDVARLHAKPLEQLDADILDTFIWSAAITWGELSDLKHFLPRILELASIGDFDLWILSTRLESTKWREWPCEEVLAISNFLRFAWQQLVAKEDSQLMQDWFGLFASLKEPVTELLWLWANAPSPNAQCGFAEWIALGKWQGLNLPNVSEIFTPALIELLEARFFENADGPCAEKYAQAVDLVRSLVAWKDQNEN